MRIRIGRAAGAAFVGWLLAAGPAWAATGDQIIATARLYLGVPYKFGASMSTEVPRLFDCTAFTKYVFQRHNIYLPRTGQYRYGTVIPASASSLKTGDLLYFKSISGPKYVNHVGIYMGGNRIIHTYGKPGVCISVLFGAFWGNHLVTARRMPGVTGSAPNESPVGYFDAIVNGWAYGWALDRNTATQDVYIHVYIDGPAGGGGTHIGTVAANRPRPDVNRVLGLPGNHGFAFPIPVQFHRQPHRLWVYALDTWGGVNPLLPGSPRAF